MTQLGVIQFEDGKFWTKFAIENRRDKKFFKSIVHNPEREKRLRKICVVFDSVDLLLPWLEDNFNLRQDSWDTPPQSSNDGRFYMSIPYQTGFWKKLNEFTMSNRLKFRYKSFQIDLKSHGVHYSEKFVDWRSLDKLKESLRKLQEKQALEIKMDLLYSLMEAPLRK
jgi:hypothetical protein